MAMARLAFSEHHSSCNVERGEQRGSAVPHIVVGNPFHIAQSHRQNRLRAVEGLNLTLLVNTQDQGVVRRI